jgi:lysophospholipase L1-like esterase
VSRPEDSRFPYLPGIDALRAAVAGGKRLTWDGIHPTPAGAGVYARLISRTVRNQTGAGATRQATTIPSR